MTDSRLPDTEVIGAIPWSDAERTVIQTVGGATLVFEVVPWCVRHDDEATRLPAGCGECRIGWEETEPCDVRYDGSGHVWRFIPSSLNEYGSGYGS